ncbi:MAG: stage III sporulation protein AF [Bacillota bacterium]|nr:stage III sporulation protein AF [Bacillota bacterium]MDD3850525.1 stage III sporulation protein AF [Bacillota bacterium]MDD4707655.1 stage III sporulation protein AF [Bacillota bacterium]
MAFLRDWVVNIVITMIFVTIVEIMMPGGSTRKYIGLVIGLMVMFVIISPFVTIMAGDFDLGQSVFEVSRSIQLRDVSLKIDKLEQGNRDGIVKLYKSNLEEQIKKDIENSGVAGTVLVEVEIDEQYDNQYFGSITGIRVMIQRQLDTKPSEGIERVEKVVVDVDTDDNETEKKDASKYTEITETLARTYNVPQDSVDIVIP